MKKYILLFVATLAAFLACNQTVEPLGSTVSADKEGLDFAKDAVAEDVQTFNVTADGEWLLVVPQWAVATPSCGTGNAEVKVYVTPNTVVTNVLKCDIDKVKAEWIMIDGEEFKETGKSGAKLDENKTLADSMYFSILHYNSKRSSSLDILCDGGKASVKLSQAGDPNYVSTIEKIAVKDFIALPDDAATWYQLTGTVVSIEKAQYSNFYLSDGTEKVLVYGLAPERGGESNNYTLQNKGVNPGDEITVIGTKGSYKGEMEMLNGYYVSHISKPLISLVNEEEIVLENPSGVLEIETLCAGATVGAIVTETADWLNFVSSTAKGDGIYVFRYEYGYNAGDDRNTKVTLFSTSEDGTITSTIKVPVSQKGGFSLQYKKVTSVTSGKKYLLVSEGQAMMSLSESKTYGYPSGMPVTPGADDIISSFDLTAELQLVSTDGGYKIIDCYGRAFYMKGTYDSFNISSNPTEGYVWEISFTDGVAKITNVDMHKYIQWDSSHSSFGSYDSEKGTGEFVLYERIN